MLTLEQFKVRLNRTNHPDRLHIGIDSQNESQLYLILNGGIANINCVPIEQYAAEIKTCALEMIRMRQLYLKVNEVPLCIGKERSVYGYSLKLDDNLTQDEPITRRIYFSSLFIRWQRAHELSDKQAQELLSLTTKDFHQFRDDELTITQTLINKIAEVTGMSIQFWQNRWDQQKRDIGGNNENI